MRHPSDAFSDTGANTVVTGSGYPGNERAQCHLLKRVRQEILEAEPDSGGKYLFLAGEQVAIRLAGENFALKVVLRTGYVADLDHSCCEMNEKEPKNI
jgi:hypothetical protein